MEIYYEVNWYHPDYGYTTMYACDTKEEAQAYIEAHPCKDGEKYVIVEMECDTDEEE